MPPTESESGESAGPTPAQPSAKDPQVAEEPTLPPLPTPRTKTPVQFNQQVNVYQQIPSTAWDKLSNVQTFELTKQIIQAMDVIDKRHFDFAMDAAEKGSASDKRNTIVGGIIAVVGIGGAVFLGVTGHEAIAVAVAAPIATIIAVVVGRKLS